MSLTQQEKLLDYTLSLTVSTLKGIYMKWKNIFGCNRLRTAKVPSARSARCLGSHFSKQGEYGLPSHLPIERKL